MPKLLPKSLPDLDKEHWKYSNVNAVLAKLELVDQKPLWEMTGAFEFMTVDQEDTIHLIIPKNRKVDKPIDLKLIGEDGKNLHTNVVIDVEEGANVKFVERQVGVGAYWKNISIALNIDANAQVGYYRLCEEDPFCVVTEFMTVNMERDARFNALVVNGCSGFGRNEFKVNLNGAGSEADLAGLALLRGKQHGDTTVCIDHIAPYCKSSQFFKTILEDQSRGVYQGKIHVYKDAQKTDGYQLSNNLLLSPLAEMDVKPELEIYADDVKCSHGTTTGELDETPMFYLRSRGLNEEDARHMLIEAFVGEVLDKVSDEQIRALFDDRVKLWLK
ncbi:MAG: Fe-S cluster assembly protein SufD [Alphaproteobacteria bacterium CG1_02_46_17]|nr:MAG: Fe-S cluster assembly protein SufD [Alphaproteobacteria bacterium CG1_02_46_17]